LPALLSFLSLGSSAVAAGTAVEKLFMPLLALSAISLGYAHYRVWVRNQGSRISKIVLVANTALAVLLWATKLPV
jgi:hypothetical protein